VATITTNDLKNGMTLELDDGLFQIVDFQHVKPGKGHAFVRTSLRNVRAGGTVERTFRAGEKVQRATIDKREMNFLYRDGDDYVFMDNETYEQINVSPEALGDTGNYIVDGSTAILLMFGTEIVGTDMAAAVELNIAATDPGLQGDRSSGGTKPATLETGLVIQVPLFIETGERVRIDTRSGEYLSRA
jgi:elongation factor P